MSNLCFSPVWTPWCDDDYDVAEAVFCSGWWLIVCLAEPIRPNIWLYKLDQVNSANLLFELWSMDTVAMDIMIYDSTGPLQGSTGWYLMVLGQYGVILVVTRWYWVSITWYWLVLIGIEWYWVNKGLLCLYILKKLMVTSTDRPTDQPTNRANIEQSAFSKVRK